MTHPRPNATSPGPSHDADRLGDAWDALVTGSGPLASDSSTDDTTELIAMAVQLSAEATLTPTRPTLTFRNHLRETLMHSGTLPMNAASPAPTFHPLPQLGRPVEIGQPIRSIIAPRPGPARSTGMRWAAIAVTIALLLATAAGGFLATRGLGSGEPTRISGFAAASPETEPATPAIEPAVQSDDPCARFGPYHPCGGYGPIVASGLIAGSLYPDTVTDGVTEMEMSAWSINPGQRAVFPVWTNPPAGMGMDIVIDGAYAATFSGAVVVARMGHGGTNIDYPVAGDLVELTVGDSVSYALGTRGDVSNPLATRTLEFKSLEFFSWAITPGATPDPASSQAIQGSYSMVLDGAVSLPQSLDAYPNRELTIYLTFGSAVSSLSPAPDEADGFLLGPVTSQSNTEGSGGFIVWAVTLGG